MSKAAMYEVVRNSTVPETYYISFNAPLKSLDGIYHLFGLAGDPAAYFAFFGFNTKGQKLKLYSNQICSIQLSGSKKTLVLFPPQKVAPGEPIETPDGETLEPEIQGITEAKNPNDCFYADKVYSYGAKINVGGKDITCINGSWR
ncbi:DUF1496 domain-containing protein [Clostridium sp. PL3]|uniref:DUF1496 domain-containing protein n=1 Tax=Clostridium thailandense TaxID=2794346 RepID=A0A949THF8_9CLOT|nr:DUF1496 domain-containing protein [Clostridium thailandense]MBV7272859.1 DUF1496 domain-containing protein [Clostridium thailandense]